MSGETYTTLHKWFQLFTEATNEVPSSIIFGVPEYSSAFGEYATRRWPSFPVGEVVLLAEVHPAVLNHSFSCDFGGNDSPNFCAWSEHWVIFSDNYDGAESVCWVPRHPMVHEPIRPGGG